MKDERNHHGAVDKSFSEQRILIVDANYILFEKIEPVHVADPGLTAGSRRNIGKFGNFRNHCTSKDLTLFRLTKLHHYIIITAVEMHSRCFFG